MFKKENNVSDEDHPVFMREQQQTENEREENMMRRSDSSSNNKGVRGNLGKTYFK